MKRIGLVLLGIASLLLLLAPETCAQEYDPLGARLKSVKDGVEVETIAHHSLAKSLTLQPGDVILKLNNQEIKTPTDLRRALIRLATTNTTHYQFEVKRNIAKETTKMMTIKACILWPREDLDPQTRLKTMQERQSTNGYGAIAVVLP